MKTSNIILFSLIGSISFVTLAGLLQLRFTGTTDRSRNVSERKSLDVPLTEFKYLVISETINLEIVEGSQLRLVVNVGMNDPDALIRHRQAGDTLFINQLAFGHSGETLIGTLTVNTSTLKLIKASNSMFSMNNLSINNLEIDLDHSQISANAANNLHFGNISINATDDSRFSAYNISLDTVDIHLDRSAGYFDAPVIKLKGVLKNNSSISAQNTEYMEVRKDRTSRID